MLTKTAGLTNAKPETAVFEFYEAEPGGTRVEFRLIYQGRLPAEGRAGGRTREKHELRKHFHKQLKELWQQHPDLKRQSQERYVVVTAPSSLLYGLPRLVEPSAIDRGPDIRQILPAHPDDPRGKTWLEHIADDYQRCGTTFVPLVSKMGGFTCSLDILFLRRDNPGNLITSGGDIDNRIKVLLDGLKVPSAVADFGCIPLEADENPFFCLLQDDSLITKVSVTTDRLLTPQTSNEHIHDVSLVICVTVLNPSALFAGGRLI